MNWIGGDGNPRGNFIEVRAAEVARVPRGIYPIDNKHRVYYWPELGLVFPPMKSDDPTEEDGVTLLNCLACGKRTWGRVTYGAPFVEGPERTVPVCEACNERRGGSRDWIVYWLEVHKLWLQQWLKLIEVVVRRKIAVGALPETALQVLLDAYASALRPIVSPKPKAKRRPEPAPESEPEAVEVPESVVSAEPELSLDDRIAIALGEKPAS